MGATCQVHLKCRLLQAAVTVDNLAELEELLQTGQIQLPCPIAVRRGYAESNHPLNSMKGFPAIALQTAKYTEYLGVFCVLVLASFFWQPACWPSCCFDGQAAARLLTSFRLCMRVDTSSFLKWCVATSLGTALQANFVPECSGLCTTQLMLTFCSCRRVTASIQARGMYCAAMAYVLQELVMCMHVCLAVLVVAWSRQLAHLELPDAAAHVQFSC